MIPEGLESWAVCLCLRAPLLRRWSGVGYWLVQVLVLIACGVLRSTFHLHHLCAPC
jgi:hypothetical protein